MRIKRVLAVAVFAAAALGGVPAASADCHDDPNCSYDCVMAPCHPEDTPEYLLTLIFGDDPDH